MPDPVQFKVKIDADLKDAAERVFSAQGVDNTEGVARLLRFFIDAGEELHPVLLGQLRGRNAADLLRLILDRLTRGHQAPFTNLIAETEGGASHLMPMPRPEPPRPAKKKKGTNSGKHP